MLIKKLHHITLRMSLMQRYYKPLLSLLFMIGSHYSYSSEKFITLFTHHLQYNYFHISITTTKANQVRVVGHIMYQFDAEAKKATIISLEISSEYQQKGFGTKLMFNALNHMRNKQISQAEWYSETATIPFYQRFGAQEVENNKMIFDFIKNGDPEKNLHIHYKKQLSLRSHK